MNHFKKLNVWQKSIDLAVDIYKITEEFPNDERYGLSSQMKRSAVSIPCNIAEGAGRNSSKEFNNFLGMSNGSSCELETLLVIANRLELISDEITDERTKSLHEIQRMLTGLQQSLTLN
jgi:four helix bundle protein